MGSVFSLPCYLDGGYTGLGCSTEGSRPWEVLVTHSMRQAWSSQHELTTHIEDGGERGTLVSKDTAVWLI